MSDKSRKNKDECFSYANQQSYSSVYRKEEGKPEFHDVNVTRQGFRDGEEVYREHRHVLNDDVQDHEVVGSIHDYNQVNDALKHPLERLHERQIGKIEGKPHDRLVDDSKQQCNKNNTHADHHCQRMHSVHEENEPLHQEAHHRTDHKEPRFLNKVGDMTVRELLENTSNLITNTIASSKNVSSTLHSLTQNSGNAIREGLAGHKTSTEVKAIVQKDIERLMDAVEDGVITKNEFERAARDGLLWLFEVENKASSTSQDIKDMQKSGIDLSSATNQFGGVPRFENTDPHFIRDKHTVNLTEAAKEGSECVKQHPDQKTCPKKPSSETKGSIKATKESLQDVIREGGAKVQIARAEQEEIAKDSAKKVKTGAKQVAKEVKQLSDDASSTAKDATKVVKDVAKDASAAVAKGAKVMAKDAANVAKEVADDASKITKNVVKEVAKDVKNVGSKVTNAATEIVKDAKNVGTAVTNVTAGTVKEVAQDVKNVGVKAAHLASDAAKEVAKDVKNIGTKASNLTADAVKEVAKDAKAVGAKVSQVASKAVKDASKIDSEAKLAAKEVKSAVKDKVHDMNTVIREAKDAILHPSEALDKRNAATATIKLEPEMLRRVEEIRAEMRKGGHFSEAEIRKYLLHPELNIHDQHARAQLRREIHNPSNILTSMAEEYLNHGWLRSSDSECSSGYSSCAETDDSGSDWADDGDSDRE